LVLGLALSVPAPASELSESPIEPALTAEFGSPLRLSANLGIRLPLGGPSTARGLLVQVQPGTGGGAVNVGFVPLSFRAHHTQAIGVALKARLLRTWGSPLATDPGLTYAGFEVGVAIGVKLAGGLLWRVSSGRGQDAIWTWSVGLGL
jgi:hypothetical protein